MPESQANNTDKCGVGGLTVTDLWKPWWKTNSQKHKTQAAWKLYAKNANASVKKTLPSFNWTTLKMFSL